MTDRRPGVEIGHPWILVAVVVLFWVGCVGAIWLLGRWLS